jgi:hypothetical protein
MPEECGFAEASKPGQPSLGIAPEALYAIDVASFIGKLVFTMVDPEMLLIPKVNEPIVASPAVRMDYTF